MYEGILAYVNKYFTLTTEEKDYLISILRHRKIRKRQYVVQEGDICRHETFVIKGCLRSYFVDPSGSEHIFQFAIEDWWISDLASFSSGKPAALNVDALEDTEILQIEKEQFDELLIKIPQFNMMFRLMFEKAFISHQQRIIDNMCKPAKERYLTFSKKYRSIEQRVPQHQIASYLGITPEFLSQIRKQLAQNPNS